MGMSKIGTNFFGMELAMDLKNCDPELIKDKKTIEMFVTELCLLIDVKPYGDPIIVDFGEDPRVSGFSMVQLIETSLISAHFVNQTNAIYMNIFSCKEFDEKKASEFVAGFFKAKDYEKIINYRNL